MVDDVTERALLYSLQVCIEIAMDVVAMLTKDLGLTVEDDYSNLEKLHKEDILDTKEVELLKQYNGLRNVIVHSYDIINMEIVKEGLNIIDEVYEIVAKLIEIYEKQSVGLYPD